MYTFMYTDGMGTGPGGRASLALYCRGFGRLDGAAGRSGLAETTGCPICICFSDGLSMCDHLLTPGFEGAACP